MVDLARQAFSTNNFGLAAEIYGRTIKENGPQAELFLGLADSFARGGLLRKAFDAYTTAFRHGKLGPEKLKHLVTALVESQSRDNGGVGRQDLMKKSYMFTCALCRGLLNDPLTISCGHTFCRKCLVREQTKTRPGPACKVCGIVHYRLKTANIRTNVVVSNLIRKWFPASHRATELKADGNKFFEKRDFERAIALYDEAISLSDADHLLFSNRSHAYASLQLYDKALEDAERVVKMRPDWPKGFFRKGNALYELGHYEDAVLAFLQCLALDKDVALAKEYLSKSLHKILSRLPPDDPKALLQQKEHNPSMFQALINGRVHVDSCLPDDNSSAVRLLRQIMDDSVADVSCCEMSEEAASMDSTDPDVGRESILHRVPCSMTQKQRCFSVPTLEHFPASLENSKHHRSRSQSADRQYSETLGGRKRCHHPSVAQPVSPSHASPTKFLRAEAENGTTEADMVEVDRSLLAVEDLECSLCYRLFYHPVTTPCGHTFCRECLDRCLDHNTSCPMCKSSLAEYLAERRSTTTECLQTTIVTFFQGQFAERQKIHEEEMSELASMGLDNQHEIPVFVCTLGFPTVLCPLHIFEPRYRLMIRQCMESGTRQFGMCACLSDTEENFSDYGCMLEVRDVHFFPDGRSLVDTVGGRRFRVLSRGKRDGYNTAKVEFLQDEPLNAEELPEIHCLQTEIYTDIKKWLEDLPSFHTARISQHFGNIPDLDPNPAANPNGPAWAWWCTAVMPLDPRIQMNLMATCSYKERLKTMKRVLNHLIHRSQ